MEYTVIGAGHGGQALAAYLGLMGYNITLYNRTASVIESIKRNEGIELKGIFNEKVSRVNVTDSMQEVISKANVILVCIPADKHKDLAKQMSPFLKESQIIVLVPGRTLGAYYFEKYIREFGCCENIIVAETDTFILTSRKIQDGISSIMALKREVQIASSTCYNSEQTYNALRQSLPMIKGRESYLVTSLSNIGAILHPIPALFNIGRIEKGERYLHYKEGITPSICNLIEKLDKERIMLAERMGVNVLSVMDWIRNNYSSTGSNLYEVIQMTEAYESVYAPTNISTRYIYEDICTGIVPMYCLAEKMDTPNQIMRLVIESAQSMFDYPFIKFGRSDVENFLLERGLLERDTNG